MVSNTGAHVFAFAPVRVNGNNGSGKMADSVSTSAASWPLRLFAAAVLALVIMVRVTLIVDHKVAADSEECVIGMMARSGHHGNAGAGLEARLLAPIQARAEHPTPALKFLALAI
jgi:hypothetical protein